MLLLRGFLLLLVIISADGQRRLHPNSELTLKVDSNVDQYWHNLTSLFVNYARNTSEKVYGKWIQAIRDGDLQNVVSSQCLNILEHLIQKPLKHEWSAKMIDSSRFLPPGVLSGSFTELGDFDQCISIKDKFQTKPFVGRYCLATVHLPKSRNFQKINLNKSYLAYPWMADSIQKWYDNDNFFALATGVCFPSLCRADEIKEILEHYYPTLQSFEFDVTYCQSEVDPRSYHPGIWVAIAAIALPWMIIIPATFMDLVFDLEQMSNQLCQYLHCFSLINNTKVLFRITKSTDITLSRLQFFHGIRACASIFIVICHSGGFIITNALMRVSFASRYPTDGVALSQQLISQPFFNGALVVMTFFIMSGLLLTYLNASSRALKVNFYQYVLLRWVRFTFPLIGLLALNICLELIGSGPLFHHDLIWPTLRNCYENWWAHLLFISNYFDILKTCGIHTWYISAEMQIHIIAFLLMILYLRSSKLTYLMCVVMIGIGMAGIVLTVAISGLKIPIVHTVMYTKFPPRSDSAQLLWFVPPLQLIPYFIGAAIGLLLLENRVIKFSKFQNRLFWTLSTLMLVLIPFSTYPYATDESKVEGDSTLLNAFMLALMSLVWSLSNGWMVYQCAINPNNPLARALSAGVFQPLSRLSFCLYFCHGALIWYNAHQTRGTYYLNLNSSIGTISHTLVESIMAAYFLYVTFDAPSIGLLKLFFKKRYLNRTIVPSDSNNNCQELKKATKPKAYRKNIKLRAKNSDDSTNINTVNSD